MSAGIIITVSQKIDRDSRLEALEALYLADGTVTRNHALETVSSEAESEEHGRRQQPMRGWRTDVP